LLLDEQRRRVELITTVAEQLASPLETIVGYATLLSGSAGHPEASEQAAVIREQGRRLSAIATSLVEIAELDAGELDWSMVSVQVKDLVSAAVDRIRPLAHMRGVTLQADVPAGLPTLFGSRDRLVQALASLLSGAVGASRGAWPVRVTARLVGRAELERDLPLVDRSVASAAQRSQLVLSERDLVRLDVRDDAPTLSTDERLRALGGIHPRGGCGSSPGLGLAVARRIVERHGGRLWLEPGQGRGNLASAVLVPLSRRGRDEEPQENP
jgi:signal transduction histidine kinase